MAQMIARVTTTCRVCGTKIVAGASSIKYTPAVKGSARHAECFGQPDRFDFDGKPLNKPDMGDDGLDNIVKPHTNGFAEIPVENDPVVDPEDGPDIFGEDVPLAPQPVAQPAPLADPMAAMMATALAPYLESKLKGLTDENKVRQIVKEILTLKQAELKSQTQQAINAAVAQALQDLGTTKMEVKGPNGEITKLEGLQHKLTPKLLQLMMLRKNIYLPGPTGGGKSTAARKCARAIKTEAHPDGLPFYYISLNPQSSPTRIEGYQTPHGEYVKTLFWEAYTKGGVFCADEVDNSMANLWTSINNAIDSDLASFPNAMAQRHPDFILIGTGNTNLSGDSIYRDRKALDKATIARFVFLQWDYDLGLERAITLGRNSKASPWLAWVHKLRAWSKINNPAMYAYSHPRACYDGADLLAAGFSVAEAADMTVFKSTFDSTAKLAALQSNPLPTEDMTV